MEDYFSLKLKDREVSVNQVTGELLSESLYPTTALMTTLSLDLHTGRASGIWAIVLALASANILFFIYSGFAITLKRISGRVRNKYKKEDATHIILVGSENGSTNRFATAVHKELIKVGKKSFITELNSYTTYPKAEHLLILAATYGLGDAPTNASKFLKLLGKTPQNHPVKFAVLGFGSQSYPDFCQYAYTVNNAVSQQHWAEPLIEIHTVDDKSPTDFSQWVTLWSQVADLPITVALELVVEQPKRLKNFSVASKTPVTHDEGAFIIRLKPRSRINFSSGDLLAIYPAGDHRERLYSIGKVGNDVQLSVRLHRDGLGSGFLYKLQEGQVFKANIQSNPHFYFPKKATNVIMISNGTGIAPFLGMIDQNMQNVPCQLYCGFRNAASFTMYSAVLTQNLDERKLGGMQVAYSREGEKQYVKDLLERDQEFVANTLENGGVLMICGSLAMQKDLIELLEIICQTHYQKSVSFYQSHNQILMDCY